MIVCKTRKDAVLAFEHLKRIMAKLKLTLNPQKTKIVDMNEGSVDFLGFCYQKFGKTKSGRKLPYMMPSKKAMKKVKDTIRIITCRKSAYEGLEQKVEKLNLLIRGWINYFKIYGFFKGYTRFPCFKSRKHSVPKFYQDNAKIQFTDTHVKVEGFAVSKKKNKQKLNWIRLAECGRIPTNCKYMNPRIKYDGIN